MLQQSWRARAAELDGQLAALLAADGVNKAQVTATHALVMRELYLALADFMDAMQASKSIGEMSARLNQISTQNNRVRMAGAQALVTGDWTDFTKLIAEQQSGSTTSGSAGTGQPGGVGGSGAGAVVGDQATTGTGGGGSASG